MNPIFLDILTWSPLLLADGPPAGNLTTSLNFIPGGVLLGVMARRYLESGGFAADSVFKRLFLEGGAVFDNACINGAQPIPLSARSCKYDNGFTGEGDAHGVVDLLLAAPGEVRCPDRQCGHPVDYFSGFCRLSDANGDRRWRREKIHRRLITRTAVSEPFGTADTGRLYTQDVIEEGQTFTARIELAADAGQAEKDALSRLVDKTFDACIGRGRSRGQGWVYVSPCEPREAPLPHVSESAAGFVDEEGRQLLTVTFLSDAIFSDDYLRDISLPRLRHLCTRPPTETNIVETEWGQAPHRVFADTRMVSGFQGAPWNLPREPRLAVTAGSVISFRAAHPGSAVTDPAHGGEIRIGERTAEGFGRAVIWHPFHLDFRPSTRG